jgi:hypothetical protein
VKQPRLDLAATHMVFELPNLQQYNVSTQLTNRWVGRGAGLGAGGGEKCKIIIVCVCGWLTSFQQLRILGLPNPRAREPSGDEKVDSVEQTDHEGRRLELALGERQARGTGRAVGGGVRLEEGEDGGRLVRLGGGGYRWGESVRIPWIRGAWLEF